MRMRTFLLSLSVVVLLSLTGPVWAQMTQDDLDFLKDEERCNKLRAHGTVTCNFWRKPKQQPIPQPFSPGPYQQQQQQLNQGLDQLSNALGQIFKKQEERPQPSERDTDRPRKTMERQNDPGEPNALTPADLARWRDMQLEALKALSPPAYSGASAPMVSSLSIRDARWDNSPSDLSHDDQVQRVIDDSLSKVLNTKGAEDLSFSDSLASAYSAVANQRSEDSTDPVLRDAEYFLMGYRSAIDKEPLMSFYVVGTPVYNAIKTLANATGNEWLKGQLQSDKDKPNAPPGGTEWAYYGLYLGLTKGSSAINELKQRPVVLP